MNTHHCWLGWRLRLSTGTACLVSLGVSLGILSILSMLAGCPQPVKPPAPKPAAERPLRVIVVDDPELAAQLSREWLAHTEQSLEVVETSSAKAATAEQLPVDVVIYPPPLLGQLASRDLLATLEESVLTDPEYNRNEIFPFDRTQLALWGPRTVAVPLGSPQLVLFYRADLFAAANLSPPQTWEDYAELVKQFQTKPDSVTAEHWQATAEPLADGWGAPLLLARAAGSAVHRDQLSPLLDLNQGAPLIAGPPWQRALEQLAASAEAAGEGKAQLTPADCYEKFQAGQCAMAITWPQPRGEGAARLKPEQIGMALLPGSREVFNPTNGVWEPLADEAPAHVPLLGFAGRLASVTQASSQPREATAFVLWLSGPKASGRIASQSKATVPFRASHYRGQASWRATGYEADLPAYGELVSTMQDSPRRLLAPRIPGAADYLAALDAAVQATVRGEKTAEQSLTEAADAWKKISVERGTASQQRAMRRSLGLD
jgi:ABC-type glycerol-3-phosphate transport system substrate-binding protein